MRFQRFCAIIPILFATTFSLTAFTSNDLPESVNLDHGWRLWLDRQASWKDDTLYLPDEVNLAAIPVNSPTGGWSTLSATTGIPVDLPGTVEEHYWDENAASESPSQVVNQAHAYLGVSWWYRPIDPPPLKPGERLIISFPGARLRAEVYLNEKLIGYNLITEAPFTVDATDALNSNGPNLLAVRITNPGGNYAWEDFTRIAWGKYEIPQSHGFGGLAGGVTMSPRAAVSVTDLAVLNKPEPGTVHLMATVKSTGTAYDGPLRFSISDGQNEVWTQSADVHVPAGGAAKLEATATVPNARLWDIGQPNLYTAAAQFPSIPHAERSTTFGFRWFTAKGIGTDAKLYLNGRRVVLRSAISWGHWAPNDLFPDAAAAQREVDAVQALGLNCIQNHRHMPKEVVLDAFDHAGLFRYCEAGAGCLSFEQTSGGEPSTQPPVDTSGKGGEATTFTERYERAKLLAMVQAFRSHPSVPLWVVQNETSPDLHNPKLFQVMREMHEIDPSRPIVLKSGTDWKNQVWALPYSDDFMHDDGTGVSGWRDEHSAGSSPGVYIDEMYKSPTDFLYNTTDTSEIAMWGEMATAASPDNHQEMAQWYREHNIPGYDRAEHEVLTAAYEKFLDDYHFRSDFPTAGDVFKGAAAKHYFAATRLLENARICDAVDYIVLSGWESTIQDNHSGLVDDLRFPKGDPKLLHEANAPTVLVVRPRHFVVAKGDSAVVDVHLVNEDVLHGAFTLSVSAIDATGHSCFQGSYPVTAVGGETFAQLLKDSIQFSVDVPGPVNITASLSAAGNATPVLTKSMSLLVVDPQPAPITKSIAYVGGGVELAHALQREFKVTASALGDATGPVDDIIWTTQAPDWKLGDAIAVEGTDDPGLYQIHRFGPAQAALNFRGLAPGPLQVELFFVEPYWDAPGKRIFDVALNGQVVLKDFDIFRDAGGKNRALVKTFTVDSSDGTLRVSVPSVAQDFALLAAVRITDSQNKTIRGVLRQGGYHDPKGAEWKPLELEGLENVSGELPALLDRVRQGSRLIILSNNSATPAIASALAQNNVLTFSGMVGKSDAPWMGFWYFGRKHWLLDGLPSGCVLDWQYQVSDQSGAQSDGLMIQAPQMDAVIGYGKDHCPNVGIGAAVLPVGKGSIVLCCLPGLAQSFTKGAAIGFDPITATRILYNALR